MGVCASATGFDSGHTGVQAVVAVLVDRAAQITRAGHPGGFTEAAAAADGLIGAGLTVGAGRQRLAEPAHAEGAGAAGPIGVAGRPALAL